MTFAQGVVPAILVTVLSSALTACGERVDEGGTEPKPPAPAKGRLEAPPPSRDREEALRERDSGAHERAVRQSDGK